MADYRPRHAGSSDSRCCICENTLINTRRLPCNHEICFTCVQNMVKAESRRYNLTCPLCRGVFTVPTVRSDSLEQPECVKEKYKSTIEKTPGCDVIQHSSKIMGMAILEDKLFVVCKKPPNTIFQYDIDKDARPISEIAEKLVITDMKWPRGMAANNSFACLYITDWSEMFGGKVWRYDVRNSSPPEPAASLDVQPFGVSYSSRSDTILVTCSTPANVAKRRGWIYIYRDFKSECQKLRTVELSNMEIPRHSVLTFADKFLVCHGWNLAQHGVTALEQSVTEEVKFKSFYGSNKAGGGSGEFEMNRPLSMIMDEDGLILVVDYFNHRIQLLTENLFLLRHIITEADHGVRYPRHVCIHSKTGRLFAGLEDGGVLVFDAR